MYEFPKNEKLCSKIEISELFNNSKGFLNYPFSIRYRLIKNTSNPIVKVLITSPKKYNKTAIRRNRIKRLIRESYRLNKEEILNYSRVNKLELHIFISYIDKELPNYKFVSNTINIILDRIINDLKLKSINRDIIIEKLN